MAIRLKDSNTVFYEVFKTGSTFIRRSLDACGIEYENLEPYSYMQKDIGEGLDGQKIEEIGYFRHSPWWAYRYTKNKFCIVRHPITWYESVWKFFHSAQDIRIKLGFFQDLVKEKIIFEQDFNVYIQRIIDEKPGIYTRIIEQFTGPDYSLMSEVLKTETLNEDLYGVLFRLGYPDVVVNPILIFSKANSVDPSEFTFEWDEKQKKKILYLEQEIVKRFYKNYEI